MAEPLTYRQLAAKTLAHWEREVRPFAPDEHLRWQSLLLSLPGGLSPAQLRDALLPLAAKNEREQALFAEMFARAQTEMLSVEDMAAPPPDQGEGEGAAQAPRKTPWGALAAALALVAVLILVLPPSPPAVPLTATRKEFGIEPKTAQTLCFDSTALQKAQQIGQAALEVADLSDLGVFQKIAFAAQEGNGEAPDTLATPFARYALNGLSGYLTVVAGDSVGLDSVRLHLYPPGGQGAAVDVLLRVRALEDTARVAGGGGELPLFVAHPMPYDHDPLLEALEIKPDPVADFLARWAAWIKAALLLLWAGALALWVYARARRRQKLVVRREKPSKPPYVWNIRIPDLAPPDPGEQFGLALNALRRRTDDDTHLLDLPETVRATIRKGGMAEFRFRRQTRPPEYLMLLDRQNALDHRARLYDDLYRTLLQNEVLVERFFFDGDVRLCHNEQHPDGLGLEELLFRFPAHRLLVIGSGRQFFSAATGKLAKWATAFARWKDRALLSPLPAAEWGRRERSLAELFRFAPASTEGLRRLIEAFDADEEHRQPHWERLAQLALGEPVRLEAGDLLATLEKHYPDPLDRRWIAACAIWPELHYDLTLWLGHCLAQESGRPVATMNRLGDLLRLPWFAEGEMPDPARAHLLDWLRTEDPTLENRLRAALHALLEHNAPPPDSAAWDDFALQVAFNEWQFTTDPATKKAREQQIADWIARNGEPDFITVRALQGKPGPLDSLLPDSWKKILYKGQLPALGLEAWANDALRRALPLWIAAAALLGLWHPQTGNTCTGQTATLHHKGQTRQYCAKTPEDQAILQEYRLLDTIAAAPQQPNNSTLQQINKSTPQQFNKSTNQQINKSTNQQINTNLSNALYNKGVPFYRAWDSLPPNAAAAAAQRDRACAWWAAAAQTDTSRAWVRAAAAWCVAPDQPPPTIARGPCWQVSEAVAEVGFRNRILTRAELREIGRNPSGALARQTLIRALKPGEPMERLGETTDFWRVRADDTVGYVAKTVYGQPSLRPCGRAAAPGTALDTTKIPVPNMVLIKGGTFRMGSEEGAPNAKNDEKPAHEVRLSDYYMGRTEVTNAQFVAFLNDYQSDKVKAGEYKGKAMIVEYRWGIKFPEGANGRYEPQKSYENHPVVYVTWYGATEYCRWLSEKTGQKYRLPTEAEWEYAARGGVDWKDGFAYSGGNQLDEVGWYGSNSNSQTHPIAQKKPNQRGLYDMSGNVWEWCGDWYWENYYEEFRSSLAINPTGPKEGTGAVLRGGSWSSNNYGYRPAGRSWDVRFIRYSNYGFRLAKAAAMGGR